MRHVDLFSGIGGFALAARWAGLETIQFVEIDPFAQRVLRKNFPDVPIHTDIRDFDATQFQRTFLLTGGYPCQPFSQAGKRGGEGDDRHLWPEMLRVIRDCRPTWVLAENVAGHITMGLDTVLVDLESEDYSTRTFVIPACATDAPHRRDRVWIVGYANGKSINSSINGSIEKGSKKITSKRSIHFRNSDGGKNVGDSNSTGCKEQWRTISDAQEQLASECRGRWKPEPSVGRVAHGIQSRVDRLRGLGNSIVPKVAYEIIRAITWTN